LPQAAGLLRPSFLPAAAHCKDGNGSLGAFSEAKDSEATGSEEFFSAEEGEDEHEDDEGFVASASATGTTTATRISPAVAQPVAIGCLRNYAAGAPTSLRSLPASTCAAPRHGGDDLYIAPLQNCVAPHRGSDDSRIAPLQNVAAGPASLRIAESPAPGGCLRNYAAGVGRCISSRESNRPLGGGVKLHVYDLNRTTKRMGVSLFHLGVEVYGCEHFYSTQGLLAISPGSHQIHVHREVVLLGRTSLDACDVQGLLIELGSMWQGPDYAVLGHNCQAFAKEFCERLGVSVPSKYCKQGSRWRGSISAGAVTALMRPLAASVASGGSVSSSGACK